MVSGRDSSGERRLLSHALWFVAIMVPMAAFTYGIGELSFGSGRNVVAGGFAGLALIFALVCLGLTLACFGDIDHHTTFLLRWLLFMVSTLLMLRYVLFYPIAMLLFGLGEGFPRDQPQRLIVQTLAAVVWSGPASIVLALGQKLVVPSARGSALLWFLLHFATVAIAFALMQLASRIRVDYQPLTGVLLAAPGLAYAAFAPCLLEPVSGLFRRLPVALAAGLLAAWLGGLLVWLADGRPARDAALWPVLATSAHMPYEDRQDLARAMWRMRGGVPMRIGQSWYRFPEGWVRVVQVARSDRYPAYGGVQMFVDMSGLVRGWPSDRDTALVTVGAGSNPAALEERAHCPQTSGRSRRLPQAVYAPSTCWARWGLRGNSISVRYPIAAQDNLAEIRQSLERLLNRYAVEGEGPD